MTKPGRARLVLIASGLLVLLTTYLVSYAVLSRNGAYTPAVIGLNGVKWYSWEPAGFADENGRWGLILPMVYLPLYLIDRKYWHTDDRMFSGSYPVHRHPPPVP